MKATYSINLDLMSLKKFIDLQPLPSNINVTEIVRNCLDLDSKSMLD